MCSIYNRGSLRYFKNQIWVDELKPHLHKPLIQESGGVDTRRELDCIGVSSTNQVQEQCVWRRPGFGSMIFKGLEFDER